MDVYPYVSVNLELKEKTDLSFPFLDYGYLYGYGLFESVRVAEGRAVLIQDHLARMKRGAAILDIPFLMTMDSLTDQVELLIAKNDIKQAILNLYLTPGNRPGDPQSLNEEDPFLMMVLRPWPNYDRAKRLTLEVREESFQRTRLDRLKTLSWMKNVLERKLTSDADDVLLYSREHGVLEASSANVFFVKGEHVFTPKSPVILPGITRQFIINNQEKLDVDVSLSYIALDDLGTFDEVFLTNALKGVVLVDSLCDYPHLSSKGISETIQKRYFDLVSSS